MLKTLIPWSFRGVGPFLNTYGDALLFGKIKKSPPIPVNPNAPTAFHSAVPHKYLYAYLFAIKSFLRFYSDIAVVVHDDGSLEETDMNLIRKHLPGVKIITRQFADETFNKQVNDPFLSKVRSSYTSYIKLFDCTLFSEGKRIVILDTDTLFLKYPDRVIDWCKVGGDPWFHRSPKGQWKTKSKIIADQTQNQGKHIQTLITESLSEINENLSRNYKYERGFCSGFIGYEADAIKYDELKQLFELLFEKFGDKIFKWGAEQTVHGLVLCGQGAVDLPVEDYFVHTRNNSDEAHKGTFVHFVGENRFYRRVYPKLTSQLAKELITK